MTKRILAALCAAAAAGTILVSCGNATDGDSSPKAETAAQKVETEETMVAATKAAMAVPENIQMNG